MSRSRIQKPNKGRETNVIINRFNPNNLLRTPVEQEGILPSS